MRWTSTLATAGLAELAAHFLSVGWGFAVLLGGFCAVASLLRVTAAKVSGTEARLAAHVTATAPAVNFVANGGSVGGNVTVNGSHTVTGNMGVQGGTTMVGSSSCSGDFTIGTNGFVNGGLTVNNNFKLNGGTTMPSSGLGSAPSPPSGTGGAAAYAGNFYSGSGAYNWANSISLKVDNIICALQANNITN